MDNQEKREKLGTVIQNELTKAEGRGSDELAANRQLAMAYYRCMPRGDEEPEVSGKSRVVSSDVADMVNAVLALVTPMLTTDSLVEFEPNGLEDEAQAAAESDAVSKVIMDDCLGYLQFQAAIKDSFLLKNGAVKVRVENDDDVVKMPLPPDLPAAQRAALIDTEGRDPRETRTIDGDMLTVTTRRRYFRLHAVPIENISYAAGHVGPLKGIRFFSEHIDYTRSQLVELGAPKEVVDELHPSVSGSGSGAPLQRTGSDQLNPRDAETRDQDLIDCEETYVLIDLDGDGISERYRCLVANESKVLAYEPADLLPYAMGSPFLNPHRITGESLFDHLKPSQDVSTALTRQLIDNVRVINNGRYAYDPSATSEEDVLTPRAGGGIRARNPAQSVVPIPIPDVTSGILAALQYNDMRRAERGGSALDMLRPDRQVASETAWGTERQMGTREALSSMLATNLAQTMIRDAYLLMHETMRRYADEPLMVKRSGQYIEVDPRSWPKRTRVNVTVGMTPGQRGHQEQALAMHQQLQMAAVQAGGLGVVVDLPTIYRTSIDRLRLAGLPNPSRYVVDPESPAARQAAQQKSQEAQAQAQKQDQVIERTVANEEKKTLVTRLNKVDEVKFDYAKLEAETESEEARVAAKGVIDLTLERERGRNQQNAIEQQGARDADGSAARARNGGE